MISEPLSTPGLTSPAQPGIAIASKTTMRISPEVRQAAPPILAKPTATSASLFRPNLVLEGALTLATGSLAHATWPAYSLSISDTALIARPRDATRLVHFDRSSQIAATQLGETLTYVQLGIHQHGFTSTVDLLPVKNRIDPLALIKLGEPIATKPAEPIDVASVAEGARQEPVLARSPVSVQLLSQLDLAAQAQGVWAQAVMALEMLPDCRPGALALGLFPESTLLAIYSEGNSLRDWLLVGRAIAQMRIIAHRQNMRMRQLSAEVIAQTRGNLPWRQTLHFTHMQALLQVGQNIAD